MLTTVLERVKAEDLLIWGHSLGTGVFFQLLHSLNHDFPSFKGVILESAFVDIGACAYESHIPQFMMDLISRETVTASISFEI